MIFSKFRSCCCLGECISIGCCWQCNSSLSCPIVCRCGDGSSCEEEDFCPCGFSNGVESPSANCAGDCEPFGVVPPEFCDEDCDPPGDGEVFIPVKCVKCSYFDTDAAGDALDITAGTPLLEETICMRAKPGVTSGTNFGYPTNLDNDQQVPGWEGATGGIGNTPFSPNPCDTLIYPFGESTTGYHLASIEYCACSGCTSPELFIGDGRTTTVINVCGAPGW
jgi:hypothetical protein